LIVARAVAEAAGFDQVVLVPSSVPPHKRDNPDIAPAEHRLAMCKLAIEGQKLFAVDDLELSRTGPSYTIDTARELKKRGWPDVHWLIGADMVQILPKWHEAHALAAEVNFVIMARPGWDLDWEALPAEFRHMRQSVVRVPMIEISATEIRNRLRARKSVDWMMPPRCIEYAINHGLYR
jgi:nicotinate-nucleotide adenylyltransferase